jgi:hypothetical protein
MKILYKALAGLIISCSLIIFTANAGLIEFREFEGNNSGLIYVEDLNMEFLNLSYTANKTHSGAISDFSSDGFSDTSIILANQLFEAIGISSYVDRATPGYVDVGTVITHNTGFQNGSWNDLWFTWFGDLNTGSDKEANISLSRDGTSLGVNENPYYAIKQLTSSSNMALSSTNPNGPWILKAALLGREVKSVPEPSTLAIFALGMIGLASRRFKKQ